MAQGVQRQHKGRRPAGGSESIISSARVWRAGVRECGISDLSEWGHGGQHPCSGAGAVRGVRAEEARSAQIWRYGAAEWKEREVGVRTVWGGGGERHLGPRARVVFSRIGSSVFGRRKILISSVGLNSSRPYNFRWPTPANETYFSSISFLKS
jgi:hypothetical protein